MKASLPISADYRRPIFQGLAFQAALAGLSGSVLDFGATAQLCGMALVAFWGGAAVLIWRRRRNPSRFDLGFIRIGYLPVIGLTFVVAPFIWHLRGLV